MLESVFELNLKFDCCCSILGLTTKNGLNKNFQQFTVWHVLRQQGAPILEKQQENSAQMRTLTKGYEYLDITQTQTHKATHHIKGPVDLHTHINIYLYHLLCAHSNYFYYIEWIIR